MKSGVFFHRSFKGKSWPVIGDKYAGFPEVMAEELKLPNVVLFEPEPAPEELLLKAHSESLMERVKSAWYYEGARRSVGGCVKAVEKVWRKELVNALVFSVAAGHHAGPTHAWGGTYLSCVGPAIINLRDKFGVRRVAIIDTDSHHGDGDRSMFKDDYDVLHVCFCSTNAVENGGVKVDVDAGWRTTDEEYLTKVQSEFVERAKSFKPALILHFFGHDTCQGDYGDRGLTPNSYPRLAQLVKECADSVCEGRYVVITGGGFRRDVAEYVFPKVLRVLAGFKP